MDIPGDFEIIDNIFTGWVSPKVDLYIGVLYFQHSLEPSRHVNIKDYLKTLLKS
jgi:hypothetical protein